MWVNRFPLPAASLCLLLLILLQACAPQQNNGNVPQPSTIQNGKSIHAEKSVNIDSPQPLTLVQHAPTPTPTPTATKPPVRPTQPVATGPLPVGEGKGAAPYGPPPPMTELEIQLTQKLFALINSDRAQHGLYPYTWNATLAGGARLHSWNMYHCGFSHTCPDGKNQCQRIAEEGFAGYTDCGENIGYAGPYPTPWDGVYKIQESMVNELPTGWHRIHLFSTTLHRIGVGIYVDPKGFIWFTEDMVS
ncbi:MAG: hypothetical protein IMW89_15070 [Ktedonobacteraceae bacterium]|nr:hypothetical protein [Ktedonobacteraceae bacterium]